MFAAAVRAARVESGLSQAQLAERAGVGLKTLQRVEQGVGRFTLADAAMLASALGRSLDQLVAAAAQVAQWLDDPQATVASLADG